MLYYLFSGKKQTKYISILNQILKNTQLRLKSLSELINNVNLNQNENRPSQAKVTIKFQEIRNEV